VAQMVKNPPAMQKTPVWSFGQEDPLEKGMATYFIILAWRIPWTEEPSGLQSMGSQRVRHNWETNIFFHFQYSILYIYHIFFIHFSFDEHLDCYTRWSKSERGKQILYICLYCIYIWDLAKWYIWTYFLQK